MPARKKKIPVRKPKKRAPAKRPARKAVKKKAPSRKKSPPAQKTHRPAKETYGVVTHYFPKVRAAVVKLSRPLSAGDEVRIKGHTTDFKQKIASIQIDHVAVTTARKGDEIGIRVSSRCREHDLVLKS